MLGRPFARVKNDQRNLRRFHERRDGECARPVRRWACTFFAQIRKIQFIFALIILIAALCGCPRQDVDRTIPPEPQDFSDRKTFETLVIGYTVKNRPIECIVFGQGNPTVLVIGAIHGDEKAGAMLCLELIRFLYQNPEPAESCRVVIIPIANPDGYLQNTRNNANGVDINRDFWSKPHGQSTSGDFVRSPEPASMAIISAIRDFPPSLILSIHQPLNCIDYDGPSETIIRSLSRQWNIPVRKLGSKPGSLGNYAGEMLGIPTITIELPAEAFFLNRKELWDRFGAILLSLIRYVALSQ